MASKRKNNKLFKTGVAATCFLSLSMTTFSTPLAYGMLPKNTVDIIEESLNIYPVPQKIEYKSQDTLTVNDVNVVMHGVQEEATFNRLKETLEEHNISYEVTDAVVSNKANIILSSEKEHCDDCDSEVVDELGVLEKNEGYLLSISDDVNENGIIRINGADKDGVYYGVLTLDQILDQAKEGKLVEVVISDNPEIGQRGFIEGFYGTPWSHEDRISLMEDTSKYKMNTYIYAPKDDPYHREQWKELYPEDKAQEIAELAQAGTENNLNFCWTIHPGATLQFTEADYEALINKFEQLYGLGVRQFGVLFDDTDDWSRGKLQAEWINRINQEFVKAKGDVAPMIVISARYNSAWGPNMNRYFKPFMETIDKDIEVMWTGHATMSNVSKEVFEWPKIQTGVDKDMAVWWNYPVNDYCDSRMLMAPMHNLSTDLDNVTGFYSNPMNQAEASKIALYSIADYTWNTDAFDYMKSWETSIEKLVPEAAEEFKRFASNISYLKDDGGASGAFEFDESWYLTEKIDALNTALDNKEPVRSLAEDLLSEFQLILKDYETITRKIDNENLLKEIEPFVGAYKALAEAGIASMKTIILNEENNENESNKQLKIASEKLESMNNFTVLRLESEGGQMVEKEYIVSVGSKRLKPLVAKVINLSDKTMIPQSEMTATATSAEEVGENNSPIMAIDGDENTLWHTEWSNNTLPQSITLNLGGKYKIDKFTYLPRQRGDNGIITEYEVQISTDGENFITVSEGNWEKNSKLKIVNFDAIEATDIKLIAKEAVGNFASAAELNVYKNLEDEEIIISKVKSLKATNTTNSLTTLTWVAPEHTTGLTQYVIYKDGKELAKVSAETTEFEVTDLKANTIYGFKVVAKYSNDEVSKPTSVNIRTKK